MFNLASDPSETTDISAKEPALASRLKLELAAWRLSVAAQANTPNPNFDPAKYRPIYTDIDVSRYNASQAGAALHERVQAWRKAMNNVLPK